MKGFFSCRFAVVSGLFPRAAVAILALLPGRVSAQVKPNAHWQTLRTQHFYVHFTPELEELARRTAVKAETAYVRLSRHLHPPRGPIDVVISDDVDFTNGSATMYPTNRIVLYANPPVFESALRFTDDPIDLVVLHELTHVFHLDRTGGIWKPLQLVFGRSPFLFPNSYAPSWLVEGLAVYYESLLGTGRLQGSEHRMIARTAAMQRAIPRLDQISLANPNFPYGYSAYAYGSLFMDYLGRKHGDSAVRTWVESSSRQLIPLYLNAPARRAFHASFTTEFRRWADSLVRSAPPFSAPLPAWRDLTHDGAYASFARWLNDSTIVYTGTPGRESYGAYRLTLRGNDAPRTTHADAPRTTYAVAGRTTHVTRERIGRRNSRSPNSILPDGSLLYSQLEFTGPYTIRSDLYVDRRGRSRRLTRGARLAFPDARGDGLIAAVNILPGGTRIALVSPDGRRVTPITTGGLDETWMEPRWSPDGKHIAVIRWTRGGTSELVVIDTAGRIEDTLVRERALNATPSWSPDGRYVYFSSDRTGTANLYRASFRAAFPDTLMVPDLQRVSDAATGLFEPQPSAGGDMLAATVFRADGYHVGVAPLPQLSTQNADVLASVQPRAATSAERYEGRVAKYSPWRMLVPRYWMPFVEAGLDPSSTRVGALTSANDVVARHAYQALLFVPTDNSGITGSLYYRNARLGQPLIEIAASQDWENYLRILDASQQNRQIGMLRRRIREASASLTFTRPRARTSAYASFGAGIEARDYAADSAPLLARVDTLFQHGYYYPRLVASAGWGNTQYPPLAISPEDGITLASTVRYRWRTSDSASGSIGVVSSAKGFKSLDLPGFAHHVLAVVASAGAQNNRGTGYYEVGGISSATLDVIPGYTLGEGRKTFGVRGFPPASQLGIRAFAGSAEYRAPLRLPGRGLGLLPLYLDRTSLTVFADAGSAWCPDIFVTRAAPNSALCTQSHFDSGVFFLRPQTIASAGAELNLGAALLNWDAPVRLRFGLAVPVTGQNTVPGGVATATAYFTVGVPF